MSAIYRQVFNQLQSGVPMSLDLTNPEHRAFYQEHMENQGLKAPDLSKRVSARSSTRTLQPSQPTEAISSLETTNGQHYSASVVSSVPSDITKLTMTLQLQDSQHNVIGRANRDFSSGQLAELSVKGAFTTEAPASGREIIAVATCHYTGSGGAQVNVVSVRSFSHPTYIGCNAPKDRNQDRTIKIAVAEQMGQGCDYVSSLDNNQVTIPFAGVVKYSQNIIKQNGKPSNATAVLTMFDRNNSQNVMELSSPLNFFEHSGVNIQDKEISWDLDWLKFSQLLFRQSTDVYFIFTLTVQLQSNHGPVDSTAIISNKAPGSGEFWNTLLLPSITFIPAPFPPRSATIAKQGYLQGLGIIAYNPEQGPFTVEGWINATGSGTLLARKIAVGYTSDSSGFLLVLKSDGRIKFATDDGWGYFEIDTEPTKVINGGPHHIAAVRDGTGKLHVYLDGNLLKGESSGSKPTPLKIKTHARVTLGATDQDQEPFRYYNGQLCLFRIWNIQRTIDQIAANTNVILAPQTSGLVAQWQLIANGKDSSALANNLNTVGAANFG